MIPLAGGLVQSTAVPLMLLMRFLQFWKGPAEAAPHKFAYSEAVPTPSKFPTRSSGHFEYTPRSAPELMDGTRFVTCKASSLLLSKEMAPPTSPLLSEIAISAQFQNSSGDEDLEVHEFVVM